MNHSFKCLKYMWLLRLIIKSRFPNHYHAYDFPCSNVINYKWVWKLQLKAMFKGVISQWVCWFLTTGDRVGTHCQPLLLHPRNHCYLQQSAQTNTQWDWTVQSVFSVIWVQVHYSERGREAGTQQTVRACSDSREREHWRAQCKGGEKSILTYTT